MNTLLHFVILAMVALLVLRLAWWCWGPHGRVPRYRIRYLRLRLRLRLYPAGGTRPWSSCGCAGPGWRPSGAAGGPG
jgi:hypothetical protein